VHRGEELTILVKGPNLLVKTAGVALEDGYIEKEVKVRKKTAPKPGSGFVKPLVGILVSSTEVEVILR
jgi:flagella basal body P-ring formation protein FlgA